MCSIEAHEIKHISVNDEESTGGGRPLQLNSTK